MGNRLGCGSVMVELFRTAEGRYRGNRFVAGSIRYSAHGSLWMSDACHPGLWGDTRIKLADRVGTQRVGLPSLSLDPSNLMSQVGRHFAGFLSGSATIAGSFCPKRTSFTGAKPGHATNRADGHGRCLVEQVISKSNLARFFVEIFCSTYSLPQKVQKKKGQPRPFSPSFSLKSFYQKPVAFLFLSFCSVLG